MTKAYTVDEVRELVRVEIRKAGTQENLARRWRMPTLRPHLSAVINGREEPYPLVLRRLRLTRVVLYVRE
jgi:hypothetical protein